MTNNPDSKAPDRIWVSAEYANSPFVAKSKGRYIPADDTEYTRTDAITPQQAAKVLLDHVTGEVPQQHAMMILNAVQNVHGLNAFKLALKALAESKDD